MEHIFNSYTSNSARKKGFLWVCLSNLDSIQFQFQRDFSTGLTRFTVSIGSCQRCSDRLECMCFHCVCQCYFDFLMLQSEQVPKLLWFQNRTELNCSYWKHTHIPVYLYKNKKHVSRLWCTCYKVNKYQNCSGFLRMFVQFRFNSASIQIHMYLNWTSTERKYVYLDNHKYKYKPCKTQIQSL